MMRSVVVDDAKVVGARVVLQEAFLGRASEVFWGLAEHVALGVKETFVVHSSLAFAMKHPLISTLTLAEVALMV